VEMVGSGVGGWVQVRDMRTNIIGWAYGRYLESFPVAAPRPVPKSRAPARKEAPETEPVHKTPGPPKAM
jgi:hypothetical protein